MFTDSWILGFGNALMKVSAFVANIICITQIWCKFTTNALLIYNTWLNFFRLKILLQLFAQKIGCKVMAILLLRSCNCLAAIWSLTGKNYSDHVSFIGFLFWLSCNILNKHINGRICEANWIIKSGEDRA